MNILSTLLIITTIIYFIVLFIFFLGLFFPNRQRNKAQPFTTVLIAARNEEATLPNLINALLNQTYLSELYEIIVINDGSSDRTSEIINELASKDPRIRLVNVQGIEKGLTAKKNALHQGIKHSRGEIILSIDADCHVLPTWIETIISYFTPDTGMVIGFSQLGLKNEKRPIFEKLQALDFLSLMAAAQGSSNFQYPLAASGQNLAYRRKTFEEAGGFSEIGHRVSGDDVLLLQIIRKKTSWKIRFAPSEDCFNSSEPQKTFSDLLHQRIRWASNGSYQLKLNKGFFLFVITVYLLNLNLILHIPVCIITGSFFIPLICLFIKFIIEWLVAFKGAQVFHRSDLIRVFPLWFILQIPYVVLVGLLGSLGSFTWKHRKHNQNLDKK